VVAYTVPQQWSMVLKRDRDRQTIFLMKQYARGILNWQVKHNTLPASLEQLQEARQPRMLRGDGKWRCPITGNEDDWIMVPPIAVQPTVPGVPVNLNGGPLRVTNPVTNPQPVPVPVAPGTYVPSKLNKELSPPDYAGQFVAVRPKASGKSFIALNGAEDYSEWVFTVDDLRNEIQQRQSLVTPVTIP
jgi:hypothetical protein